MFSRAESGAYLVNCKCNPKKSYLKRKICYNNLVFNDHPHRQNFSTGKFLKNLNQFRRNVNDL